MINHLTKWQRIFHFTLLFIFYYENIFRKCILMFFLHFYIPTFSFLFNKEWKWCIFLEETGIPCCLLKLYSISFCLWKLTIFMETSSVMGHLIELSFFDNNLIFLQIVFQEKIFFQSNWYLLWTFLQMTILQIWDRP
jgi:hypothetical protein